MTPPVLTMLLLIIASHFSKMICLLPVRLVVQNLVSLITSWIWF